MKTIKQIQYVSLGLILLVFLEGMMTLGSAFSFECYNTFAWIVQAVLVVATVTTALRIEKVGE